MPRADLILDNFNSGELSPLLAGRLTLKNYPNGNRRLRNFIPTVQGPNRKRGGTNFVAEVKDSADRTWLGKFIFNTEQAYVTEIGDQYIRFFSNHGVVGAPFEVSTPYTAADLVTDEGTLALNFLQSNDVQYICHPSYQQRKLTRTGASTFSIAALNVAGGPFKDIDPDQTITVYASAATGAGIGLTASSAIFLAGHVGSLFLLEQRNTDDIEQWETGKSITAGDIRRSDGKNYIAVNTATTGTVRPTHTVGDKYDGDGGVQWTFSDPGYGWVLITAIGGGGTTATATVLSRLPYGCVGSGQASTRWAHGAWSDVEGWPSYATFYKERLVFFRGRQGWGSVSGDFENFQARDDGGIITPQMAITFDVTSDQANDIVWAAPTEQDMLIGTAGDEISIGPIARGEPFGPGNIDVKKFSAYGSRRVPVIRAGDGILCAQAAGRKVRDVTYKWETEGYKSIDVTVLAEHIAKGGIVDAAYQQEPDSVAWFARADGMLLGFTINREQEVKGWHPHRIGGYSDAAQNAFAVVEAVVAIPAPDRTRDELWMIVRRYVDGATVRYVEWMRHYHERGDDPELAFYVDSGLPFNNTIAQTLTLGSGALIKGSTGVSATAGGAVFSSGDIGKKIYYRFSYFNVKGEKVWDKGIARITAYTSATVVTVEILRAFNTLSLASGSWQMTVTTLSGLDHLIGQTVQVYADGSRQPDKVVDASGEIELTTPAAVGAVGLSCASVMQPMPLEPNGPMGTTVGKRKRVVRAAIKFDETLGAKYGRDEDQTLDEVNFRTGSDEMDYAPSLFTGDKLVAWPDGSQENLLITIVQEEPMPCCVVAIAPRTYNEDD